jgi:hypothetical protein
MSAVQKLLEWVVESDRSLTGPELVCEESKDMYSADLWREQCSMCFEMRVPECLLLYTLTPRV